VVHSEFGGEGDWRKIAPLDAKPAVMVHLNTDADYQPDVAELQLGIAVPAHLQTDEVEPSDWEMVVVHSEIVVADGRLEIDLVVS
jgi:hypothetical protein